MKSILLPALAFLFTSLLATNTHLPVPAPSTPTVIRLADCSPRTGLDLEDWIDSSYYVVLDYDGIIQKVRKVLVWDKYLYVQDEEGLAVLQFSTRGRHIRNLGSVGDGPGQYLSVDDIALDTLTGHLFVLSLEKMAILEYTPEGTLVEEQTLPVFASELAVVPEGFLLFLNSNANELTGTYEVVHVDRKLHIKDLLLDQPNKPNYISLAGALFQGSESTLAALTTHDTIFAISPEGSSAWARYVLDFSPNTLPTEFRSNLGSFFQHSFDYDVMMYPYFETPDWFIFNRQRDQKRSIGWYHKPSGRLFDAVANFKKGSLADFLRMNPGLVSTYHDQFIAYFPPYSLNNRMYINSSNFRLREIKSLNTKPLLLFFTLKAPPL